MCLHQPAWPPADGPGRESARTVAFHPEQGWSLLCNGVVLFEDTGVSTHSGASPDADVAMHVARSGLLDVQVLAKRLWRGLGEGISAIAVLMSASAGCGRLLSPVAA